MLYTLIILPKFPVYYFQCKFGVKYRSSISKTILTVPHNFFNLWFNFSQYYLTKFFKLHFPVLFPCNSHTNLFPLLCIRTIIVSFHSSGILSSSQICLTSSHILFNSSFPPYFINSRCIPSAPAASLFLSFLLPLLHLQ